MIQSFGMKGCIRKTAEEMDVMGRGMLGSMHVRIRSDQNWLRIGSVHARGWY
jgi:hypothetical protein